MYFFRVLSILTLLMTTSLGLADSSSGYSSSMIGGFRFEYMVTETGDLKGGTIKGYGVSYISLFGVGIGFSSFTLSKTENVTHNIDYETKVENKTVDLSFTQEMEIFEGNAIISSIGYRKPISGKFEASYGGSDSITSTKISGNGIFIVFGYCYSSFEFSISYRSNDFIYDAEYDDVYLDSTGLSVGLGMVI